MALHGFILLEKRTIPELNIEASLYRHEATAAELLSVVSDDENKTFGVAFRTPPTDSTGLPHILEHSVLSGSRKYPLKEPFVELLKSSLQTFLNAFTYPDKTCYPVASQNLQDFYNLVDVYLDAVFFPRISPETLQQEGWHYELEDLDAPLTIKGVVFNEMKGAFSSPDTLVSRYSQQELFPDSLYGFESGGDPGVIPTLTYEQFRAFHRDYYHPANARIFFYGDDDPEERLRLVNAYLREFEPRHVDSAIQLQPKASHPWHVSHPYPAGDDPDSQKHMLTVNWLLPENNDPTLGLALGILSHILMGTAASPLRKALIDSGLGEDVIGAGIDDDLRQIYFSVGLKGIESEKLGEVEHLIIDTLASISRDGIDPDMIEASLNTLEFSLREQNFGSFPRGLVLMLSALTTWLHDGDPFAPLEFEGPLAAVKEALAADSRYFERLVEDHILENTHRLTFVLEPDPELQQLRDDAERERLAAVRKGMSIGDLEAVMEQARRLKELQETPNPPEALATIPRLNLSDLDTQSRQVPTVETEMGRTPVLHHDLFTNGIVYLDLGMNLHTLPQELLPYVSLFSQALLEIGTETEDFVKLTQRIGRKTGGIRPATFTSASRRSDQAESWLFLRGKATMDHAEDLLSILRDILLTVRLDNRERFQQMLLEQKAMLEASLVPAGARLAVGRLRAKFHEADWATEQMGGATQLFALRDMVKRLEQDWPDFLARLEEIRRILVNREAAVCNVTIDERGWARFQPLLRDFIAAIPSSDLKLADWSPDYRCLSEGLAMPAEVNYVSKGANLRRLGYVARGSASVITNYLGTTWLWDRIRAQGGAYGAACVFSPHSGTLAYVSWRDPNVLKTLETYDRSSDFLRQLTLTEDDLVKSIISTIGDIDAYQLPDAKGYSALRRRLIGYTDEMRQRNRDEVLATTADDFRDLADVLDHVSREGLVVALGSQGTLEAANATLAQRGSGDLLQVTKIA